MTSLEEVRAAELLEAQTKAEKLFHEVEARGLIRPGITESQLSREVLVQRLCAMRFQIPERDRISLVHGVGLDQPEMPAEHEKHE